MTSLPPGYEPQVGQIFTENQRGEEAYQLLYVDDQIVLLRSDTERRNGSGNHHRMMTRTAFEEYLDAGTFEFRPDAELDLMGEAKMDWSEVAYVGEQGRENLYDAGFETALDVVTAEKDDLLDVDSIGQQAATNIREYIT